MKRKKLPVAIFFSQKIEIEMDIGRTRLSGRYAKAGGGGACLSINLNRKSN